MLKEGVIKTGAIEINRLRKILFAWSGLAAMLVVDAQLGSAQVSGPVTFTAGVAESFFGRAIAAGDFNGDGFPDILVGAPGNLGEDPTGINPASSNGRAYIYYGPDFATFVELNNPAGALTPTAFGWAVTAAEACTEEGITDAIVSEPNNGGPLHFGAIHRYTGGSPDPVFTLANPVLPFEPSLRFGVSLDAGRVDLSGPATLAVGSTGFSLPLLDTAGRVFRGPCTLTTGLLSDTIAYYCVEPNYGAAVAASDTVAGTVGTILVGAPYALRDYASLCIPLGAPQGRAHVTTAGSGLLQWYELYNDIGDFGTVVAAGSDLYAGRAFYADSAVGAPFAGQVYLFDGNINNPYGGPGIHPGTGLPSIVYGEPSQILDAPPDGGHFGRSVVIAQLNPDSATQGVVVGAPLAQVEGLPRGKVYVFDGSPDFVQVAELGFSDQGSVLCSENLFFGWALAVADFDQNGRNDIAASRPCHGTLAEGAVTVFFGCAVDDDCATGVCGQGYCRAAPE